MAGEDVNKEKLNHTLETIATILHQHDISDWFVMFGTLLGIVREDSCIDNDDDIDIFIRHDFNEIKSIFENTMLKNMRWSWGIQQQDSLLHSNPNESFAIFDFYFCLPFNESQPQEPTTLKNGKKVILNKGDFYNPWHQVLYTNAYVDNDTQTLIEKPWRSTKLNLPNNYKNNIVKMYGEQWNIPSKRSCSCNIQI